MNRWNNFKGESTCASAKESYISSTEPFPRRALYTTKEPNIPQKSPVYQKRAQYLLPSMSLWIAGVFSRFCCVFVGSLVLPLPICCSVLQCVAVYYTFGGSLVLPLSICCSAFSVLQCVLQWVAGCYTFVGSLMLPQSVWLIYIQISI